MKMIYKCQCMKEEFEFPVMDRLPLSEAEDWLENVVMPAVGYHHRNTNPRCTAKRVEYIKVPHVEGLGVGEVPTRQ